MNRDQPKSGGVSERQIDRPQFCETPVSGSRVSELRYKRWLPTFGTYCANVLVGFGAVILMALIVFPVLLMLMEWARPTLVEWGLGRVATKLERRFRLKGHPLIVEYSLYLAAASIVAYPFLALFQFAWCRVSARLGRDGTPKRKMRIS